MITWKRAPSDPLLARYIDCYWYLETDSASSNRLALPRLMPNPAAHCILAPVSQPYLYQWGKQQFCGHGSHMMLPNRCDVVLHHDQPLQLIGIKFQVGAMYHWPLLAGQPLMDHVLPMPTAPAELCSQSLSQDHLCAELDAWLRPMIMTIKEDRAARLTRTALPLLATDNIASLGDKLHCAQRSLERSFLRVTGMTLKQYQSMKLLERLLLYLYQHREEALSWAEIAAQFGFSDQPHLIRYFKRLLGTTPNQYAQVRDLTIDAYGEFE